VLTYTQYLTGDGFPLVAEPGEEYEVRPAGGLDMPVPPPDGNWEDATPPAPSAKAPKPSAAPSAPASSASATSTEGN